MAYYQYQAIHLDEVNPNSCQCNWEHMLACLEFLWLYNSIDSTGITLGDFFRIKLFMDSSIAETLLFYFAVH